MRHQVGDDTVKRQAQTINRSVDIFDRAERVEIDADETTERGALARETFAAFGAEPLPLDDGDLWCLWYEWCAADGREGAHGHQPEETFPPE